MLKDYFEVPNKPAIKSGNVLSCDFTDHETFIPQPLDFTRNTLATYVDCNGLIKVSGVIDTNLSPPEDFATDFSSNPSSGTAVNNPDGTITFTNSTSNGANVELQNRNITTTKIYQIKFTISNYVQGTFRMSVGNQITPSLSANGTYVFYLTYTSGLNRNYFYTGNSTLTVSDISVKEVDLNTPRIDYTTEIGKAKELQKPSLLLEPQSTNLLAFSENFSNYTTTNVTVTNNQGTSPDGLNNAAKMLMSSGTGTHRIYKNISSSLNDNNTFSVFIKEQTEVSHIGLNADTASAVAWFSGANGSVINANGLDAKTQSFGNGWHRISVSYVAGSNDSSDNQFVYFSNREFTTPNVAFNGTESVLMYGFQAEKQSYVTSYIPTSGSTVTRNGEVCNNAGQLGVFPTIAEPDGTFYGEFKGLTDVYGQYSLMTINDNSSDNLIGFGFNNVGNRLWIRCKKSNATVIDDINQTYDVDKFQKVAIKFSPGSNSIYLNGNQIKSNTSNQAFNGDINQFDFNFHTTLHYFYGRVREIKSFRRALTDTELTELTNNIV